ncbi:MAG: amino acid ABC transporter permease [Anaerolineae bacterium]|nr:amino acid ABC transporter permease [Anaerolineae bacterium]
MDRNRSSELTYSVAPQRLTITQQLARLPYWLLAILLLTIFFMWSIANDGDYRVIFSATVKGVGATLYVSLIAFVLAIGLGLAMGLLRVARLRIFRELAMFYVEIVRGIPMLVILYYIAFVGAPALVAARNWLASPLINLGVLDALDVRDLDFTARAVIALMLGYGAFIAEIFRAGIESIGRGQMEAAQSLGMNYVQCMRYVILPQAVRNVLPPLGNEFIAMVKDSALVSALGVQDITQLGKVYSASTFRFFETYNVVAFLYLVMTLSLSLLLRVLEQRLKHRGRA